MHAGERDVDPPLVRSLLESQLPQWADLSVERVRSAGTDNAIYRLGDDMAIRLPRIEAAVGQVGKEQRWLPRLAPHLPLDVPVPLARGEPGAGFPWPWSVYRWLPGEDGDRAAVTDPRECALRLAELVTALQAIDPSGGPSPGEHNAGRGVPLVARDGYVRDALSDLGGEIDVEAAAAAWEASVSAPEWTGAPAWLHGDLAPGNLLIDEGRLRAVIDFGCLGVGDPACDVMVAWTFVAADHRETFRAALRVDDATWMRARGWALSVALIALPYYRDTNPVLAGNARRWIAEVLADQRPAGR
jgi:aminoglycoside phosphotransferase (APT) family kinase protein